MYNSALSLTMTLDWDGWLTPSPSHFTAGKETRYTSYSSVGLWAGTDGKEKSRLHRDQCPDSTANDTFLLSSKWHKEVFNDFRFYHVFFFSDMSRVTTAIHHIHSSRPSTKTLKIHPRDLFL